MRLSILFYIFSVFISITAVAQQSPSAPKQTMQRVVVSTDTMRNIIINGETIDRLIGNVILEHNNIIMTCDSAYRYPNDKFEAYSNVRVVNNATTVSGDKMIYDGSKNLAQVRGNIVYLTDGSATLRTTAIDYNTKEEVGFFENEGTIKDPQNLLESKQGYYYSKLKDFVFVGNVQAKTENYTLTSDSMKYNTDFEVFNFHSHTYIWSKNSFLYCDKGWYDSKQEKMFFLKNSYLLSDNQEAWSDSIYYESASKQGKFYGNIQLWDTVQKSIGFGDLATFNIQTEDFEITCDPSIMFYSNEQTEDTLYLRADILKSYTKPLPENRIKTDSITGKTDSVYREMFAYKNARIFRSDIQAACDSLYFSTLDSVWKMYHTPILWNENKMQLTSDTIKFLMVNEKLDKADFQNNSMIIVPENDSSLYYHQVKGKNMAAHFKDNEIQNLDVFGNVQCLFFSSDEQAMLPHEASSMTFRFKDKKIRQIAFFNEAKAKAIPLFMTAKEDATLKGFVWHEEKRPKSRYEILTRTIKESRREEIEAIAQPDFPITKRINALEEKTVEKIK